MSQKKLRLGILSDSHRKTDLHKEAIEHLLSCGVEYLLHAGDLEKEEHLKILEDAPVPYEAVYGNNDTLLIPLYGKYNIHREPFYLNLNELKIKMMHLPFYLNPDADIVISGHTHRFEASLKNGTLFINPGEVCAREKPLTECAVVDVVDKEFTVTHYFRELSKKEWIEQEVDIK